MKILAACKETAGSVARLHAQSITTGFLSTMPAKFLAKLYSAIAKSKGSFVLVAVSESGEVSGFIAGTISVKAMYKEVITSNFLPLIWYCLPKIVSIDTVKKIMETFRYGMRKKDPAEAENKDKVEGRERPVTGHLSRVTSSPSAELLSIAVDKTKRGAGIGKDLVAALEQYFKENGVATYKVVTFSEDVNSNAFYTKCGFTLESHFVHHGNVMNEYIKKLS